MGGLASVRSPGEYFDGSWWLCQRPLKLVAPRRCRFQLKGEEDRAGRDDPHHAAEYVAAVAAAVATVGKVPSAAGGSHPQTRLHEQVATRVDQRRRHTQPVFPPSTPVARAGRSNGGAAPAATAAANGIRSVRSDGSPAVTCGGPNPRRKCGVGDSSHSGYLPPRRYPHRRHHRRHCASCRQS